MIIAVVLAAFAALAATGASAQTTAVAAARQAGVVGERYDGYMDFVRPPSTSLRRQVEAINIRRRALYTDLAARRGVSPAEVGITAGCQILASVRVGEAYMLADGAWRLRGAGQPAPVPNYCV